MRDQPAVRRRAPPAFDELRMFRYPVVVGGGTPFLPPVTEDVPLDLIETRTFGSRVIYERYGRARD
jgi:dihydrofolate reductase